MDILILALNSKYIHSSLAPWYLKAEVPEATVIEHTVNEEMNGVLSDIVDKTPKLLAISTYIWNISYVKRLIKEVKRILPNIIIVLGGPEVSYNSSEVLFECEVDFIISGEGEIPFSRLCKHVFSGESIDFSGITYRGHTSTPYIGTGTPQSPYVVEYFNILNGRIAYFESSRGCPYSCAYCLSGRCEGIRFFDIDYVKDNLIKLANSGTKTIKFVDRTFNADRKRAFEIFDFLIKNSGKTFPKDVCFHFELSGDLLDDKTVELLGTAPSGLFQFEIGIQSFLSQTVSAIHRTTESKILKQRIKQLVNNNNAHVHTDLIAGLPFEGYNDFIDSFNQAYNLGADMLQLGFLKILHGTELEKRADEYGLVYSKEPPYEVYKTKWLLEKDFYRLKIVEKAVDKLHNSGRFRRTLAFCIPKFENPYDFFYKCGKVIERDNSLDCITDSLFEYFTALFPLEVQEIRDVMLCDRLATNSSRGLPKSLYKPDARIDFIKKSLNNSSETASKIHVRRSVAILYSKNTAVYVDYDNKNYKGEYSLRFANL